MILMALVPGYDCNNNTTAHEDQSQGFCLEFDMTSSNLSVCLCLLINS